MELGLDMSINSVGRLARRVSQARAWRPAHARLLWSQIADRRRNRDARLTDHDHLLAATDWLCRAQDAMSDGGVCGRYSLGAGWTSSYPETTGYIIPTFLALAQHLHDDGFVERAARGVRFLLSVQLSDGAFPAGEIRENAVNRSVFNTAQILGGLTAWHRFSQDSGTLQAADRAADWLVSVQGPDGAWRRHLYCGAVSTYTAHASFWLAEFGEYRGVQAYLDAASRHLDWVLRHQDPATGWFDRAGFTAGDHVARRAVTHTIAYTLWGVQRTAEILGRSDGIAAVAKAANRIAQHLRQVGWLSAVLDHRWRTCAPYACLTGNAQMALTWLRVHRYSDSPDLLDAACKALDLVKGAQPMFAKDGNIRGGIPGSAPIWGDYISCALPSWGAKFFVDALLEKQEVLRAGVGSHAAEASGLHAD